MMEQKADAKNLTKHTLVEGECKHAAMKFRAGTPRSGRHPRDPARPASSEPTARMPAQELSDATAEYEYPPDTGGSSSSTGSSTTASSGRGPDQEQRTRRAYRDAATGPENTTDWRNFDVARSLRALSCLLYTSPSPRDRG